MSNIQYKTPRREVDLRDLQPSDHVCVTLDTKTWMVYAGMDHGIGQTDLNPKSRITFVQTAPNYMPADNKPFNVWSSYVRFLQFGDNGVHIDYLHVNHERVECDSPRYHTLQSLVERISN